MQQVHFFRFVCLWSIFWCGWVWGQDQTPYITFLNSENGLIQNWAEAVFQDHYGFIWIGSREGLNRYDGATFTHFRHDPINPNGLPHNEVLKFREDPNGMLWIRTAAGWCNFRRMSESFSPVFFQTNHLEPVSAQILFWVKGNTLFRYDHASKKHTKIHTPPNLIRTSLATRKGAWFAWRGAFMFVDKQGRMAQYALPDPNFIPIALASDHLGMVWITVGTKKGTKLYRFTPESQHWELIPIVGNPRHIALREMQLWINTDEQVLINLDSYTLKQRLFRYSLQITTKAAVQMSVDREGGLWVPTPLDGVLHFDPYRKPFLHIRPKMMFGQTNGSDFVMSLAPMPDSSIWIGTLGNGLYHVSPQFAARKHLKKDDYGLPDNLIWWLNSRENGDLWVGTAKGLSMKKASSNRFEVKIPDWQVIDGAFSSSGALWLALYDKGLGVYDPRSGFFERYDPAFATGGQVPFVQSVLVDDQERIWVGTEFHGLFRFDPTKKSFSRTPSLSNSPFHQVWMIRPARAGGLWLATDAGLCHFHPNSDALRCFGRKQGLNASIVFSFLETSDQQVWIGSSLGLARLEVQTGNIRNFSLEDGVMNTEFNRKAIVALASGHLALGGIRGLTVFEPANIRDNPIPPRIVLTRYTRISRKGEQQFSFSDMKEIVMYPLEWTFGVEFAGLNYTNNNANSYIYRILGHQKQWQSLGNNRHITLKAMNAGHYVLQIKGQNNDGKWTQKSTDFPIFVVPFINNSPFVQLVCTLLVVGVLYGMYRKKLERALRIERLRLRIASDLHDEIGAQLSSIAIMTDMVKMGADAQIAPKLTRISTVARQMVGTMRDIVWSIDAQADTLGHLINRMKDAASLLLAGTPYTFETHGDLPDEWPLDMNMRRHNYLIFKESLHNIVRHASATEVHIKLLMEHGILHCSVEDNGKGFEEANIREGHGLRNMRERAKEIQALLEITHHRGTRVAWQCRLTHIRHLLPNWPQRTLLLFNTLRFWKIHK